MDGLQRLASEVHWRCFVVAGVCYFASDTTLIAGEAALRISEDDDGIDGIDFEVDNGKTTERGDRDRPRRPLGGPARRRSSSSTTAGPGTAAGSSTDVSRGIFDPEATIR